MSAEKPYTEETVETPLERAARAEAQQETRRGGDTQAEHEADVAVGDVDEYVAINDPAALAEAEAALNAWEVPSSPFDGVPGDIALHPGEEGEPLVSVFSAGTESEANIVKGLLESQGIAAIFREVATPAYGSIFSVSESRWADILVADSQAQSAREAIQSALSASQADRDNAVPGETIRLPGA